MNKPIFWRVDKLGKKGIEKCQIRGEIVSGEIGGTVVAKYRIMNGEYGLISLAEGQYQTSPITLPYV